MNGDLLRLVDSIHRDKDIDRDIIFEALEDALVSAVRRQYGPKSDIAVFVDRETGQIEAFDGNDEIDAMDIGRIAAQTAKQVIIQRIRDAEQDALYRDYEARAHEIVSGTIQRFEGSTIIVNLGRTEAILPRSEQVPEEGYRVGDRIRCYLLEVRRVGSRVRILLSRANKDFIAKLFELEVPEIAERVIEIKAIAREPGYRTKVAVQSADSKVDCVGACVGVRGSRIKNIVAELNDEKIDIVRWSEARDVLIANALKPAEVREVVVIPELGRARVTVPEEELSLAIGKRGRNVRLAAKLAEVEIDILGEAEAARELDEMLEAFGELEDVPERFAQRLFQMGYAVEDIAEGASAWIERFDIPEDKAEEVLERAREFAEILVERRAAEEAAAAAAEEAAALEPDEATPEGEEPQEAEAPTLDGGLPADEAAKEEALAEALRAAIAEGGSLAPRRAAEPVAEPAASDNAEAHDAEPAPGGAPQADAAEAPETEEQGDAPTAEPGAVPPQPEETDGAPDAEAAEAETDILPTEEPEQESPAVEPTVGEPVDEGVVPSEGTPEDSEEGAALPPPADEAPEGSEQTEEPEDTEITPEQ